ncbi:MAG: hypothetical protein Q4B87_01495, partial [Candidatus Saccharibacteria bacterium]|nr:hypothetical protein [Candidatus Saccharibacteria bacterium]
MYFELSLPLLWLVIFDVFGFCLVVAKYRGKLFKMILGSVWWWLFPFFVSFSAIWSLNPLRAVLTVGVMWLLVFAVVFVYLMRDLLDGQFWRVFFKWFFGASLFVSAWCVVQCILDVNGVSQEATLLCDGCTSRMFGFPHPNGFAIEPQFMGNLLLAPIIVAAAIFCESSGRVAVAHRHGDGALQLALPRSAIPQILQKTSGLLFFVLVASLFLTFSRGAIYACVVAMIFLWFFLYFRAKKVERKEVCKNIMKTVGIMVLSFVFALNLQGIFTALSPTSDTYTDGVA